MSSNHIRRQMADTAATLRITKLNNTNYQTWKFKLELLLTKEDLWETTTQDPPDPVTDDWRTKDRKARANIGLLLEDNQLHLVRKETTAKGMWTSLQRYHEKSTLSNKVSLLRRICNLKLSEGGNMEKHLIQMQDLIDQLASLGETLAEQLTVALFLSSLPESYRTLITALETRPEDDLTIELVKNKLLEEYARRNNNSGDTYSSEQKALKANEGHGKAAASANPVMHKPITCFFCKKPNHVKKECRKYIEWKRKNPDHKAKTVTEYVHAADDDELDLCFRACGTVLTDAWCIDSGATSHMCNSREFFTDITEHQGQVVLANGVKLPTAGIGEGYIQCVRQNGECQRIKITDVLYVPQLKGNLLSVRKLTAKDFVIEFEGDRCKIIKEILCVATATEGKGLYELNVSDTVLAVKNCDEKNCIHAWHNRFGHRDHEAIKRLVHHANDFHIEPCSAPMLCECCIQAKMHRKPFPQKTTSRSPEILDLVHSDVCGPMQTATPSGNRYFLTMIDDHSRYTKLLFAEEQVRSTN